MPRVCQVPAFRTLLATSAGIWALACSSASPRTAAPAADAASQTDAVAGGADSAAAQPNAIVVCIKAKCAGTFAACTAVPACAAVVACVGGCGESACTDQCLQADAAKSSTFQAMAGCGQQQGCIPGAGGAVCGNGVCDAGETADGCPQDCCAQGCTGTPSEFCGDLQCKAPEDASSCPVDCEPKNQQLMACAKGLCGQAGLCLGNAACMKAINCTMQCGAGDAACAGACKGGLPNGMASALNFLMSCADASCGPNASKCGDGTCQSDETLASCPADCQIVKCGDGVCGSGEAGSCAQDCTNAGKSGGCAAPSAKATGCLGCLCEQCVCFVGNAATNEAPDGYCCTTAWDASCAKECAACAGSGCSAP